MRFNLKVPSLVPRLSRKSLGTRLRLNGLYFVFTDVGTGSYLATNTLKANLSIKC